MEVKVLQGYATERTVDVVIIEPREGTPPYLSLQCSDDEFIDTPSLEIDDNGELTAYIPENF